MFNPFANPEASKAISPLESLAKKYEMLPDRILNSPIESVHSDALVARDASGLFKVEKSEIKKSKGWSEELTNQIRSKDEADIYSRTSVEEKSINGKECLVRTDINYSQKDEFGRTNLERMRLGLSPLDQNGNPYELHHIGQKNSSGLVELTFEEHRGNPGNDLVLHDKTRESEIDRSAFKTERQEHWKERARIIDNM